MSDRWLKIIPGFIRHRIKHRPNLLKILTNIAWLYGDRLLRMSIGLLVVVWLARYLGPEKFGLIAYATAFVALFGSFANLGLRDIVVRNLVKDPDNANTTLGSAIVLQAIGTLVAFLLAIAAISIIRPEDDLAKLMVTILSVVMIFRMSEVVKYWFESQVQSKYSVWAEGSAFCLVSIVRITLILYQAPVIAFIWASLLEGALMAGGLWVVYLHKCGQIRAWQPQFSCAMALLKDSWPLILSGIAIIIYMRIDHIMLGQMSGDQVVGVYSAAVRISELWYFFPMAIVASLFPTIIEIRQQSHTLYYAQLQKLYDLMVLLSLVVALVVSMSSGWLISFLFGSGYEQAAPVLTIYVWAGIFVSLGVARSNWLLAENLQHVGCWYIGMAMIVNIVLNLILIPIYGATGAAVATVIAQITAALIAPAMFKSTRISAIMLLRSLNPLRWPGVFSGLYLKRES